MAKKSKMARNQRYVMQICEKVSKKKVTTKHSQNCLATQILID